MSVAEASPNEVRRDSPDSILTQIFTAPSRGRQSIPDLTLLRDAAPHSQLRDQSELLNRTIEECQALLPVNRMTWCTFVNVLQLCNINANRLTFEGQGDPVGQGSYFEVWRYEVRSSTERFAFFTLEQDVLPVGTIVALKRIVPTVDPITGVLDVKNEHQLKAVALEVQVLHMPVLRSHENIATLFAVVWESRGHFDAVCWPTLVLEYCQSILNGMEALHQQSIIHGDIKSENILIKLLETGEAVAKLADFGCSLTVEHKENHSEVWIGGTPRWRAPECSVRKGMVEGRSAWLTDFYSFGLIILRIFLDNSDPFQERFATEHSDYETVDAFASGMKARDLVKKMATDDLGALHPHMRPSKDTTDLMRSCLSTNPVARRISLLERHRKWDILVDRPVLKWPLTFEDVRDPGFLKRIKRIPDITKLREKENSDSNKYLGEPTRRKIFSEIENLVSDWEKFRGNPICSQCCSLSVLDQANGSQSWDCDSLAEDFRHHVNLPHGCVLSAAKNIQVFGLSTLEIVHAVRVLIDCYLEGYGTPIDLEKGFLWICKLAQWGSVMYQSDLIQFARILGRPVPEGLPVRRWLVQSILLGDSASSVQSLQKVAPELAKCAQELRWRMFDGITVNIDNLYRGFEECEEWKYSAGNSMLHYAATSWKEPVHEIQRALGRPKYWFTSLRKPDINIVNEDGCTPLLLACRSGRLKTISALLHFGADVKSAGRSGGDTPLHWLVKHAGCQQLIDQLIKRGADIHKQTNGVRLYQYFSSSLSSSRMSARLVGAPLHWAVAFGNLDAVKALLSHRADTSAKNSQGSTPLDYAASLRRTDLVAILLQHNTTRVVSPSIISDLCVEDNSLSLKCSQFFSDKDTIVTFQLLAEHFPRDSLESVNKYFCQIIRFSLTRSTVPVFTVFMESYQKCVDCCTSEDSLARLQPFADPFWEDGQLIENAIYRNEPSILRQLIMKGAPLSPFHMNGFKATHCFAMSQASDECLKILLKAGANINERIVPTHSLRSWTSYSWTPFALAIFFARTDIAARLLHHMNAQEMDEIMTSKPNYQLHGQPEDPGITMFGALIQQGGVIRVGSRGLEYLFTLNPSVSNFMVRPSAKATALHMACYNTEQNQGTFQDAGSLSTFRLLLSKFPSPACVNAQDVDGLTALHISSWFGKLEEVGLLIEAGADVNILIEPHALTPLDAAFSGMPRMITERSPTREMLERFRTGRNAIANLLRTYRAKSGRELKTGVVLGDFIPYPKKPIEMKDALLDSAYCSR